MTILYDSNSVKMTRQKIENVGQKTFDIYILLFDVLNMFI